MPQGVGYQGFAPFNAVNSLMNAEQIRGARGQNALLELDVAREQNPNSLLNRGRRQDLRRGQADIDLAMQQMDANTRQQIVSQLSLADSAVQSTRQILAERGVGAAKQRFAERFEWLKSQGIVDEDYQVEDVSGMSDDEFMSFLDSEESSLNDALDRLVPQAEAANVQSTFVDDQGNRQLVMRDGTIVDTGIRDAGSAVRAQDIQLPDGRVVQGRLDPNTGAVYGPDNSLLFQPVRGGGQAQPVTPQAGSQSQPMPDEIVVTPEPFAGAGVSRTPEAERRAMLETEAEVETEQGEAGRQAQLRTSVMRTDEVLDDINRAIGEIDPFSTGIFAQLTSWIGGTPARQLQNALKPVKAALTFDRLQQMREESKTGGALGQVSNIELDLLGNSVESLDQAGTGEQLADALLRIQLHYQNWKTVQFYEGDTPTDPEWKPPGYLYYDADEKVVYEYLGGPQESPDSWAVSE